MAAGGGCLLRQANPIPAQAFVLRRFSGSAPCRGATDKSCCLTAGSLPIRFSAGAANGGEKVCRSLVLSVRPAGGREQAEVVSSGRLLLDGLAKVCRTKDDGAGEAGRLRRRRLPTALAGRRHAKANGADGPFAADGEGYGQAGVCRSRTVAHTDFLLPGEGRANRFVKVCRSCRR